MAISNIAAPPEAARDYPAETYAWYVVTILFLAYVISFLDRQILTLMVDPIKQTLQVSDSVVALLHGLTFAIFYTLFGIPLGRLADSRNRRTIIICGVSVWSVMTSLCGFAQNVYLLFAARIGVAVGESSLSPSAYSIIADYFPRAKRGRATSFYSLGIFAGAGVAFVLGGQFVQIAAAAVARYPVLSGFEPWQLAFVFAGLPGILIVLLMLTVTEPSRKERYAGAHGGGVPIGDALRYLRARAGVYAGLVFGVGFVSMASYTLFAWLPAYFQRVHGYSAAEIGFYFGMILLVCGTGGLVGSSYLADMRYRKGALGAHLGTTILMTTLAALPAALLFFVDDPTAALVCVAFLVLVLAAHTGLIPTTLQMITPNELRGQVIAIYLLLTSIIGLAIGPQTAAFLTDVVFADTLAVGKSMSITMVGALAIGVTLFSSGYRAYVRAQQEAN